MNGDITQKVDVAPEKPRFHRAVVEKGLTFIVAGFGFVAALAWNDAIQALFQRLLERLEDYRILAKFGYAIAVTIIGTFISLRLGRDIKPEE